MGALFGGSRSESGNRNMGAVNTASQPIIASGNTANTALMDLLGFGDGQAASAAMNRFANSAGQRFIMDQGTRAVTGSGAARGLLGSGATLRALTQFGQDRGRTFVGDYMDRLNNQQSAGLNALGIMSNAGQYSKSSSKPGVAGMAGGLLSGAAALKTGGLSKLAGGAAKGGMRAPAMSIPFQGVPGLNAPNINIPQFSIPRI